MSNNIIKKTKNIRFVISDYVIGVVGVVISHKELKLLPSDTFQLSATVIPSNAPNQNVFWYSTDENIATVDSNGFVTVLSDGMVRIFVQTEEGGYTDFCEIDSSIPVSSVVVSPSTFTLVRGETKQLIGYVLPMNATNQGLIWSSSNEYIATVDSNGLVTGLGLGNVTITATSVYDGTKYDTSIGLVIADFEGAFVTEWDIPAGTTLQFPIASNANYEYDFYIDWGDGSAIQYHTGNSTLTHTYADAGTYQIKVNGIYEWFSTYNTLANQRGYLTKVITWGEVGFTTMSSAFYEASNLIAVPNSTEGLELVDYMGGMFYGALSFNGYINDWDVSNITDMSSMFSNTNSFTQDLDKWDVSNVINMEVMFSLATYFDGDISTWDVSSVKYMEGMFTAAYNFNSDISNWDVSSVETMDWMFYDAENFNQDLSRWCVELIPNEPEDFDLNASSWVLPRPDWGVCPKPVTGVDLTPSTFEVEVGKTYQLYATVYPIDATNQNVIWSSSDESVATVDEDGKVTGVGEGSVTITVTTEDGSFTDTSIGVVSVVAVTSVSVSPKTFTIQPTQTQQLTATVLPSNATNKNVIWSSSNTSIATVNSSGKVTAVGIGNVTITVTTVDGSFTDTSAGVVNFGSAFVTEWNIPAGTNFQLPITANSTNNYTVDWGDGSATQTFGNVAPPTHTYTNTGTYQIKVTGSVYRFNMNSSAVEVQRGYLTKVLNWGTVGFKTMENAFYLASNLTNVPNNTTGLESVKNMNSMFYGASLFNSDISGWDVSNVTNMGHMFYGASLFNSDISGWDVSNVTNMGHMFAIAYSFNQNISSWNVGNVTNMEYMFSYANLFNSNISGWNVGNVTNMEYMFRNAQSFNQNISGWNVGKVTNMVVMFGNAYSFNQNISGWDTSNVIRMGYMFSYAQSFNQNISGWNVGKVTDMIYMFQGATSFNQNLSGWCVSKIPTKPNNFDTNTPAWVLPKPIWGTCP